jgi:hypothetical protein
LDIAQRLQLILLEPCATKEVRNHAHAEKFLFFMGEAAQVRKRRTHTLENNRNLWNADTIKSLNGSQARQNKIAVLLRRHRSQRIAKPSKRALGDC